MGVGLDSPWHWAILAIVVFALFGYKKLPDATRSVGRSLRIFKSEMKGMHDEEPAQKPADKRSAESRPVIEGQAQPQPSQPSRPTPPTAPPTVSGSTSETSEVTPPTSSGT